MTLRRQICVYGYNGLRTAPWEASVSTFVSTSVSTSASISGRSYLRWVRGMTATDFLLILLLVLVVLLLARLI